MKIRIWTAGSVLAMVALVSCGGGGGVELRSEGVASTTEAKREVPATCGDDVKNVDALPSDVPRMDEPMLVLGPDCSIGQVSAADFFGGADGPKDFAPIYPRGGGEEVIGYWVGDLGWVTPETAREAGWNAERARRIAPSPYRLEPGEPAQGD